MRQATILGALLFIFLFCSPESSFTQTDYTTIHYPLAIEFARYLNVDLEEITISWDEAFQLNGKIPEGIENNLDIAYTPDIFKRANAIFSTFTILDWRKKLFDFSETLYSAELIMIREEEDAPGGLEDLKGKRIAWIYQINPWMSSGRSWSKPLQIGWAILTK